MKKLILAIFLLSGLSALAQNPLLRQRYTTNTAAAVDNYISSLVGTNSGISEAQATNIIKSIALSVTNQTYINTNFTYDTRYIMLDANWGTAGVAGSYTLQSFNLTTSLIIWTNNAASGVGIRFNQPDASTPYSFSITNVALGELYVSSGSNLLAFTDVNGAAPSGNGYFYTNLFIYPNAASVQSTSNLFYSSLPNRRTVLIDSTTGNDTNAWPFPARTFDGAIIKSPFTNSSYIFSDGTFVANQIAPPANTKISGQGMGITTIRGIVLATNTYVSDLTIYNNGGYQVPVGDGLFMERVEINGRTDCIIPLGWFKPIRLVDCVFLGNWDGFQANSAGASNSLIEFVDCKIEVQSTAFLSANAIHGIQILSTNLTVRMYGGSITASNTFNNEETYGINMAGGRLELYGTEIKFGNTAGFTAAAIAGGATVTGYWYENGVFKVGGSYAGNGAGLTNIPYASLTGGTISTNRTVIINTSWAIGTLYTNTYGVPIYITDASVVGIEAGVVGNSTLIYSNLTTKIVFNAVTAIGGIAGNVTNALSTLCISNDTVYGFFDGSAGIGNSVLVTPGKISYTPNVVVLPIFDTFRAIVGYFESLIVTNLIAGGHAYATNTVNISELNVFNQMQLYSSVADFTITNYSTMANTSLAYTPGMVILNTSGSTNIHFNLPAGSVYMQFSTNVVAPGKRVFVGLSIMPNLWTNVFAATTP